MSNFPESFEAAFSFLMKLEGGFRLHEVPGDRGGMTYAGIARRFNPDWGGWRFLDNGEEPPVDQVKRFYFNRYWTPLHCDQLSPEIACSLFCCGVNMGIRKAAMLFQVAINSLSDHRLSVDGVIGNMTIAEAKEFDPVCLLNAFTLAKIARYREIVVRDRTQRKFLLGWINRALAEADCGMD